MVALANLHPVGDKEELDSYMYQSVGHSVINQIADCYGLPLYRRGISGSPVNLGLDYQPTVGDEVEDLYQLLKTVLQHHPEISGVSSGAIRSVYQKNRVEEVCARLGLVSLAYLWERDQVELLDSMIGAGVEAVLIKTAAHGLGAKHLGKSIKELRDELVVLSSRLGLNPCGEGGEYETLTLNSPLYVKGYLTLLPDSELINLSRDVCIMKPRVLFHPKVQVTTVVE